MKARHHLALIFAASVAGALASPALAAPEGPLTTPEATQAVPVAEPDTTQAVPAVVAPGPSHRARAVRAPARPVRVAERTTPFPGYTLASARTSCSSIICNGRYILLGVGF